MANYENIVIERTMYESEKSFSNMLEDCDPSCAYRGTVLDGLDAFQRQLKRFDIKVQGSNSSCVYKFFETEDSRILFPEYVRRAVKKGMADANVIDNILASKSNINSIDYRSISTVNNGDKQTIEDNNITPETKITLNEDLVPMKKHGRLLKASYEAIKYQRLDVFEVALRQIGAYIARVMLDDASKILLEGLEVQNGTISYPSILDLWYEFGDFEMNTILTSPNLARKILDLKQFQTSQKRCNNAIVLPLGINLIKSNGVSEDILIAFDKRFSLEMVESGELHVDYNKLIDCDFEGAAITKTFGFNRICSDSVKVFKI